MKKLQGKPPTIWPYALLALTSSMTACGPQPVPVPPSTVDAGDDDSNTDSAARATCATWCAHAKALACSAAKPTRAGSSCEEVCANVQTGPIKWNLKCRSAATSCAAADVCER